MRRMIAADPPAAPWRRRRPLYRRLADRARTVLVAAILVVAVAAPIWLWRAGAFEAAYADLRDTAVALFAEGGLRVETLRVAGRERTEPADLLAALAVRQGDPLLDFDPAAARGRVEALPWVREAVVERHLPGTIRVVLEEHEAVAVWQHEGRLRLVGADGAVIEAPPGETHEDLLVVVGAGAPDEVDDLLALLGRQPDLAPRVIAATRVGDRRWDLRLDNGIVVALPETEPEDAWRRLARAGREGLLERGVTSIDLRFPDRLIVRGPVVDEVTARAKGKET